MFARYIPEIAALSVAMAAVVYTLHTIGAIK